MGFETYALSVAYGQRHAAELTASKRVASALGAKEHRLARVGLGQFGGSALTDSSIPVPIDGISEGIPVTYVPARNTVMLSLALAWAEVLHANDIFVGVNAVDYSGYPDCRPEFISAFETMANLATKSGSEGTRLTIHAPLIHLTKAEIILRGTALGVDYGQTVSCYQADEAGRACGICDACRLRRAGFEAAGISDPTPYK
jgi:7-cyano-7-deazaguanine synthase